MPKTYEISIEETEQIKEARKNVTNKTEDKRLYAVQLRGEGLKNAEIAARLDTSSKVVSRWICKFKRDGINSLYRKKGIVRHCNMTFEEEEELLLRFFQKAESGQKVKTVEIKNAYMEKVGHSIGRRQIYEVLKRHNWKKGVPKK